MPLALILVCLRPAARDRRRPRSARARRRDPPRLWRQRRADAILLLLALGRLLARRRRGHDPDPAARPALARRAFPARRAGRVLPGRGQSGRRRGRLYGLGYGRHEQAPDRVLPFFPAFLAGMNLVVLADDAFTFLLSWEFMSLASWALVMAHHREPGNAHAGYVYLVMASFGTLALLLAFGLLAGPSGGYAFAAIRGAPSPPGLAGAGAGPGAARRRLQGRPRAAARLAAARPSGRAEPRLGADERRHDQGRGLRLRPHRLRSARAAPTWWWSVVVLALGGITAVLGVLYALMQHDLKRLLAYHTVENIGIIFIGLGLALAFQANGMGVAAALALTAALFHVLNHSLFKSLLFFGAGAVLTATGERDMEQPRRPDPPHAADRVRLPGRLRRDLGAAAAQRLRLGVADLPGDPAQPRPAAMGPEDPGARGRRAAGARRPRSPPPASSRPSASPSSAGRAARRPSGAGRSTASRSPRCSSSPRSASSPACFPGLVIDALAPVVDGARRRRPHAGPDERSPGSSIVPIGESRSSYNGLLVLAVHRDLGEPRRAG